MSCQRCIAPSGTIRASAVEPVSARQFYGSVPLLMFQDRRRSRSLLPRTVDEQTPQQQCPVAHAFHCCWSTWKVERHRVLQRSNRMRQSCFPRGLTNTHPTIDVHRLYVARCSVNMESRPKWSWLVKSNQRAAVRTTMFQKF